MTKITSQVASVLDSAYTPVIVGWPQNPQMLLIPDKLLPSCSSAMILRILDLWLEYLTWQCLSQCSFTNSEINLVPHFTRAMRSRVCKISKRCAGLFRTLSECIPWIGGSEAHLVTQAEESDYLSWNALPASKHMMRLVLCMTESRERLFQPCCTQVWNRCISDDWPHSLICWVRVNHMHDR